MSSSTVQDLANSLHSSGTPLDARFRALFTLKGLATSNSSLTGEVIALLGKGFEDDSALLKHELAYCLGQIADLRAVPTLEAVVQDTRQDVMVRHEAAEALGAISSYESLPLLRKHETLEGEDVSVKETCELAVRKIEWDHSEEGKKERAEAAERKRQAEASGGSEAFSPIDPAPALPAVKASLSSGQSKAAAASLSSLDPAAYDIPALQAHLTDRSLPLFERYRAMFSLRNAVHANLRAHEAQQKQEFRQGAEAAVKALAAGLDKAEKSALFRHEICFVFGELAHEASVPAMLAVLNDSEEHEMVRHEAAEALGAVAEETQEAEEAADAEAQKKLGDVMQALKRWAEDMNAPRVVRESCIVALDEMACESDTLLPLLLGVGADCRTSPGRQQRPDSIPAHGRGATHCRCGLDVVWPSLYLI